MFCTLPISQLKKTGQSFLQEKSCVEVAPKLEKCRECFLYQNQNQNKKKEVQPSNIFCRFYAFRKLYYEKNELKSAGFSESKDASKDETNFWLPGLPNKLNKFINLNFEESKFILTHAGDQLCDLINEELRAMRMHCGADQSVKWKRVVQGVREMCDVCETTLFNVHWTCLECGFCVCIECYVGRLNCDGSPNNTALVTTSSSSNNDDSSPNSSGAQVADRIEHSDRDAYNWLLCKNDNNKNNPPPHEQSNLMLTQIVTGDVLNVMARKLHSIRSKLAIKCNSNSCKDGTSALNGLFISDDHHDEPATASTTVNNAIEQQPLNSTEALTNSINRPHNKENKDLNSKRNFKSTALSNVLSLSVEEDKRKSMEFFNRDRKSNNVNKQAPRVCKIEETSKKYPKAPHQWLCDGRLLWLEDSELNDENLPLFKEQWIRGQPLIVSGISDKLSPDLWNANQLSSKMTKSSSISSKGNTNNTMFNCKTNEAVKIALSKFWEGFEIVGRRAKDANGSPLCLKLKDWPPGDDFSELLPDQFNEFFTNIPLPIYTKREGSCNLAARLPTSFVKPDLGPKMYTAYGCDVSMPNIGTTNLHLDISDALNVMVYVTVAKRSNKDSNKDPAEEQFEFLNDLDDVDSKTKERIKSRKSEIGALWHIYEAKDADKIRTFLKSITVERKEKVPTSGDPIHDQSYYMTSKMRKQLKDDYGVVGYSIVQLLGDAVFIPAGAPHQVRNIHSAIKLACDFVSPENVNHCFDLTGQFRMLSNLHSNHEDKLQIKNIIYHAVKDALTICEQITENSNSNQEMSISRVVDQYDQESMNYQSIDSSVLNDELNKRDALKSANLNDGSASNKLLNEPSTNGKRGKGLNERSKRVKLNENSVVQQPQITTNDLNNNTNNSPKRKRDETVEPAKDKLKKNRKEHKANLKMK